MTRRTLLVFTTLTAGATVASVGAKDPNVSLGSLLDLWSDALRDTDQAGMKATRVSDSEEMAIGSQMAQALLSSQVKNAADAAYVTEVAQALLPGLRRKGIAYEFHVIESKTVNAFALPGGEIFVYTGMLDFLESEAELAAILGHEISHVDLRHCIEHYQYEAQLKKVGLADAGALIEFAHTLATLPFTHYQESEADAQGERLAIEARYDPDAASAVFLRMKKAFGEPSRQPANTPAGELAQAAGKTLEDYFRSHPPSEDRAQALNKMVETNRSRFAGKQFYVGRKNLQDGTAMSKQSWPQEWKAK